MSSVSGTACGRALLFRPFILAAGTINLRFGRSNSGHDASATSLSRNAANAAGISDLEIGEQFDNLTTFIAGQIEEAADKLSAKDD